MVDTFSDALWVIESEGKWEQKYPPTPEKDSISPFYELIQNTYYGVRPPSMSGGSIIVVGNNIYLGFGAVGVHGEGNINIL